MPVYPPPSCYSPRVVRPTRYGSTICRADGYSLDDKRTPLTGEGSNDLPDVIAQYSTYRKQRESRKSDYSQWQDKTQQAFVVDKADIASNKYDLSINRYKEVVYEEEQYDPPKVILKKLQKLEEEIMTDLFELEGML